MEQPEPNQTPIESIFFYKKVEKRQLWVQPFEWLKLNFASCVVLCTENETILIRSTTPKETLIFKETLVFTIDINTVYQ